ncbi:MAG: hypothetical protein JWM21_898 [Acidobacteria bacterium]|nr:hypothetical protein [Acidobacteriota bacterium]
MGEKDRKPTTDDLPPLKQEEKKPKRLIDVRSLITVTVAGPLRNVSSDTIRRLIQRSLLRYETIGGHLFVYRNEVLNIQISSNARVRKMSNEDLLEDVLVVARDLGHVPTSSEYTKHGGLHLSILRVRFGNWPKVHAAALRTFLAEVVRVSPEPKGRSHHQSNLNKRSSHKKRTMPRMVDVNDLIAKTAVGRLCNVTPQVLNYLVRNGRLRCEVICGKPFVFRSEVLNRKFRTTNREGKLNHSAG